MYNIHYSIPVKDHFPIIANMVLTHFRKERELDSNQSGWSHITSIVFNNLNDDQSYYQYFTILKNSDVIGFINTHYPISEKKYDAEILVIYLRPEFYSKKILEDSFNWTCNTLKTLGAEKILTDPLKKDTVLRNIIETSNSNKIGINTNQSKVN